MIICMTDVKERGRERDGDGGGGFNRMIDLAMKSNPSQDEIRQMISRVEVYGRVGWHLPLV